MKSIASVTLVALIALSLASACVAMDTALDKCSREAANFDEFRQCLDGVRAEEVFVEKEKACLDLCDIMYDCTANESNETDECQDALTNCQMGCV
ncbi:hypothetical protein BGZ93_009281 [Podila epicladia]|nr:hypothetical protein BGZ92_009962 [Podila epicladia]KAG0099087.1 hypothetical protein BGZ93_009281 [Podila epicladia]